jgi:uncharacterized cupin superfamily protein
MRPHNLSVALQGLRELEFKRLASCTVGIFRTSAGVSPGSTIPTDDEFLHVLEGEVDITVITPEGWRTASVTAGAVFIVPRGLWHRHSIRENLVELFVTPGETEHSAATDPTSGE